MGNVLLKLGGEKHLGEQRWRGALNVFDKVYCGSFYLENLDRDWVIPSEDIVVYRMKPTKINHLLHGLLWRTKDHRALNGVSRLLILMMRLANRDWMKKMADVNPDYVLCSYGDYDFSNLIYLLTRSFIRKPVVRSYKETRIEYNYLEYSTLRGCEVIALYDIELKRFLERKYGDDLFEGKKVLIGNDENALPECILNNIHYSEKLSKYDGLTHVAILTFRVDSEPSRVRDQGRYYYLDLIKNLLDAGLAVHLHCAKYINDSKGINQYEQLYQQNQGRFFLEEVLEMKHTSSAESWSKACAVLSRYDAGIMHNIVEGSTVSEFDRINVPHRLFAYEAAHVVPVIKRGENAVLERMFREKRCGYVYDDLRDIAKVKDADFDYYVPSFEDYLKTVLEVNHR